MSGFRHTEQGIAVFQGVAAGQTAVAQLPIGRAYHSLTLSYGTLTDLEGIQVFADNQIIFDMTAAELNAINQYDGRTAAGASSGLLVIDFERFNLKTRGLEELSALFTGDKRVNPKLISALRVEVGIASGASTPTLSMNGEVSRFDPASQNTQVKIMDKITLSLSAAGEHTFTSFRKNTERSRAINRIVLKTSNTTAVEMRSNNQQIFKRTKAENERVQNDGVRTPQSGYVVIDFTEKGHGDNWLRLSNEELRLLVTVSGSENITAWVEYLADQAA